MFDILGLLLVVASIVHCQLCYTPSGGILQGYGPCNPTYATSLCCAVGDHCLSNSLCQTPNSIFYRGGCTSKAYLSGECPSFCGTGLPYFPPGISPNAGGSAIRVRLCNQTDSNTVGGQFCCDIDGTGECCESPMNNLALSNGSSTMTASPATATPSVVATASGAVTSRYWVKYGQTPTTGTTNALPTVPKTSSVSEVIPSAKVTPSATPKSSTNSATMGVGIGAGVGGVVVIASLIVCFRACRRHKEHKALTKRGHKPQSSISGGKEFISNPLLASPAHYSTNHSWLLGSPSTLVELASPIASNTTAFKGILSSPAGGSIELAASPTMGRAELPGDFPSELPGQVPHRSKDTARSQSTSSRKLKTLNLPKLRSPSFSLWRPPAELESSQAFTKRSESRGCDAKSGLQCDNTPATEGSQIPTRAKSESRPNSAKSASPRLISQTPTRARSESRASGAKRCIQHIGGESSHASVSSPNSAEAKSEIRADAAKSGAQNVREESSHARVSSQTSARSKSESRGSDVQDQKEDPNDVRNWPLP